MMPACVSRELFNHRVVSPVTGESLLLTRRWSLRVHISAKQSVYMSFRQFFRFWVPEQLSHIFTARLARNVPKCLH